MHNPKRSLEWRPFARNATALVPMEAKTEIKKYSKMNNVFRLVKRWDLSAGLYPTSYQIVWTMLLFRNSTTVSLFLCRVRTAQPYVGYVISRATNFLT